MTEAAKGVRVSGAERSTLASTFKTRYDEGESIRALAQSSGRNSARSRPALNARPFARTTTTRTAGSNPAPMSRKAVHIFGDCAFSCAGRSRTMVATGPSRSRSSPASA